MQQSSGLGVTWKSNIPLFLFQIILFVKLYDDNNKRTNTPHTEVFWKETPYSG